MKAPPDTWHFNLITIRAKTFGIVKLPATKKSVQWRKQQSKKKRVERV